MKGIIPKENPRDNKARDAHLRRLERIHSNIIALKSQLASYTCEPKTPSLFEKCDNLKTQIENSIRTNAELISLLKGPEGFTENPEGLKTHLKAFQKLEQQVLEYIGMAKLHS